VPKLLVIGTIWPEPQASAASARLAQVVRAFGDDGWQVTFVSDARENAATEVMRAAGVTCVRLAPNDSTFDAFAIGLRPDCVLFDKFANEEKFGWRVRAACPDAVRVLDTIDLHFLRLGRDLELTDNTTALREVAAIHRCDLALLTSDYEWQLLTTRCQVPAAQLQVCRLAYPAREDAPGYGERTGFAMFGNYRHPPNTDALKWVKAEIWPRIRARLPDARLDVWGAYPAPEHLALTAPHDGLHVRGFNAAHFDDLRTCRVNLAPLRSGAGIKGKIADGWWRGVPVVTTPIGAEGMHGELPFGGLVAGTAEELADAAVRLHEDHVAWNAAADAAARLIDTLYTEAATMTPLLTRIAMLRANLGAARQANFTGAMLWQQGLRATEYFSRWIELKEGARRPPHSLEGSSLT
jgi:hypothetical protein